MLVAAIGIGSNSLRLLIADVDMKNAQLHRVLRDREGLRVFAALDENKNISEEMITKACESVQAFVEKAKAYPVQQVHLFATSAVRDAANRHAFCQRILEATGLEPEICSGEEEAVLSFLGATGREPSGMIDIGGGSTEIVMGQGKSLFFSTSLQMGAVRLYRSLPIHSLEDAFRVVDAAGKLLDSCLFPRSPSPSSLSWVGVGGTFTTAAALVQNIPWGDRDRIHGFVLSQKDVKHCMEWLAPMPMPKRIKLNGLQPQRADIVVHGLAILLACMQKLEIKQISVSEYGNLEGYLRYHYLG